MLVPISKKNYASLSHVRLQLTRNHQHVASLETCHATIRTKALHVRSPIRCGYAHSSVSNQSFLHSSSSGQSTPLPLHCPRHWGGRQEIAFQQALCCLLWWDYQNQSCLSDEKAQPRKDRNDSTPRPTSAYWGQRVPCWACVRALTPHHLAQEHQE